MGQALSRWIDGSLEALESIEADRDKLSAQLAIARSSAVTHREALADLDREMKKLIAERERHAAKLLEFDREVQRDSEALQAVETDLELMAEALEKVAGADGTAPRPKPAPRPCVRPASVIPQPMRVASPPVVAAHKAAPKRVIDDQPAAIPRPIERDFSEPLLIAKPNPLGRVALAIVVMGALGFGAYTAVQNEAVQETAHEIGSTVSETVATSVSELGG
jgi:hypothetical protein